jgi:hypothetical protein
LPFLQKKSLFFIFFSEMSRREDSREKTRENTREDGTKENTKDNRGNNDGSVKVPNTTLTSRRKMGPENSNVGSDPALIANSRKKSQPDAINPSISDFPGLENSQTIGNGPQRSVRRGVFKTPQKPTKKLPNGNFSMKPSSISGTGKSHDTILDPGVTSNPSLTDHLSFDDRKNTREVTLRDYPEVSDSDSDQETIQAPPISGVAPLRKAIYVSSDGYVKSALMYMNNTPQKSSVVSADSPSIPEKKNSPKGLDKNNKNKEKPEELSHEENLELSQEDEEITSGVSLAKKISPENIKENNRKNTQENTGKNAQENTGKNTQENTGKNTQENTKEIPRPTSTPKTRQVPKNIPEEISTPKVHRKILNEAPKDIPRVIVSDDYIPRPPKQKIDTVSPINDISDIFDKSVTISQQVSLPREKEVQFLPPLPKESAHLSRQTQVEPRQNSAPVRNISSAEKSRQFLQRLPPIPQKDTLDIFDNPFPPQEPFQFNPPESTQQKITLTEEKIYPDNFMDIIPNTDFSQLMSAPNTALELIIAPPIDLVSHLETPHPGSIFDEMAANEIIDDETSETNSVKLVDRKKLTSTHKSPENNGNMEELEENFGVSTLREPHQVNNSRVEENVRKAMEKNISMIAPDKTTTRPKNNQKVNIPMNNKASVDKRKNNDLVNEKEEKEIQEKFQEKFQGNTQGNLQGNLQEKFQGKSKTSFPISPSISSLVSTHQPYFNSLSYLTDSCFLELDENTIDFRIELAGLLMDKPIIYPFGKVTTLVSSFEKVIPKQNLEIFWEDDTGVTGRIVGKFAWISFSSFPPSKETSQKRWNRDIAEDFLEKDETTIIPCIRWDVSFDFDCIVLPAVFTGSLRLFLR